MKQLKAYTIVGFFFVLILGTLFHFLYEWTNQCYIVGFFAPVSESVWEHMKLLFFPMLLYVSLPHFSLEIWPGHGAFHSFTMHTHPYLARISFL